MTVTQNRDQVTKETLTPDPDGFRVTFFTTHPYKAGSLSIWVNGLRKISGWDDGYTEGLSGIVTFFEPPAVGDSIQAQYDPA